MTIEDSSPASWASDELQKIGSTDDLRVSPFRENGKTYGTPTWIWSAVVDGSLYARAYNGQKSGGTRRHRAKEPGVLLPPA